MKNNLKGIAMNTRELKDIVSFFISRGISPTIKELCDVGSNAIERTSLLSSYYNKKSFLN